MILTDCFKKYHGIREKRKAEKDRIADLKARLIDGLKSECRLLSDSSIEFLVENIIKYSSGYDITVPLRDPGCSVLKAMTMLLDLNENINKVVQNVMGFEGPKVFVT